MVTPRHARTTGILSSVRQPALVARKDRATRLYEAMKARLMGASISGLRPGQHDPVESWAERRQFAGIPGQGDVGIEVFSVLQV
jgi:hypothetical protein